MSLKTLLLLRHASASNDRTGDDHDRALDVRGREQAERMGRHFAARGLEPERVLCSTARRAQQTLSQVLPGQPEGDAELREDLYVASAARLFETIAALSDAVQSALLVGHNPGIGELAVQLAARGAREDRARLLTGHSPCALAVFAFAAEDWGSALERRGELVEFTRPGDLAG